MTQLAGDDDEEEVEEEEENEEKEDDEDEDEEDDKSLGTKWRKRLRGKGLLRWLMGGGLQLSANE